MVTAQYSCIIAEDDRQDRNTLVQYAIQMNLHILDTSLSGTRLIEQTMKHQPDIIITDIELDRMDGMTACRQLIKQGFRPQIIIISNSYQPKHYSAGYELDCIDYINKPVSFSRLEKAVNKAIQRIHEKRLLQQMQLEHINLINVKHKYRDIDVKEDQILFVEKRDKRLFHIYLRDGAILETSSNLEHMKNQCSEFMFAPHRSFLANLKHIKAVLPDPIVPGNYEIVFAETETRIPLTRRNYNEYLKRKNMQP